MSRNSRRPGHRAPAALGILVALFAGACGSTPGPTQPPATASPVAATPTIAAPSDAPAPSSATGLSVGSIIGGPVPTLPPGITWSTVVDATAPFTFEVPASWAEHQAYPWTNGDAVVGTLVAAGPTVSKIGTDFSVPGVVVGLSAVASGTSPRAIVEGDDYSSACTAEPIEEEADATYAAAFRTWSSCGDNPDGFLLVIAIAPQPGPGLIVAVLQGTGAGDLAYLERILGSLRAAEVGTVTPGPDATAAAGQLFTVTVDECTLQMGDVFAIGIIRNDDSRSHSYLIHMRFADDGEIVFGEVDRDTPALRPGESYRYQTPHTLAQGVAGATCTIMNVETFG